MSVSQPATTLSSDNWNEYFCDIIANSGVPQHDLRELMKFCIENIPTDDDDHHQRHDDDRHDDDKKINFIEGINLVVMYIKMGLIDLHEDFAEGFNLTYINYKTNDDGRIIMLHIDPNVQGIYEMSHHWEDDNYVPYNLPKDILRFKSLEELILSSCRCIPDDVDLSSLPHLKKLGFNREFGVTSTRSMPSGMNLPQLKELFVYNGWSKDDVPPDFVSWVTSQLPNLEILSFDKYGALFDAIITNAPPLPKTIHAVIVSRFADDAKKNQEKRKSLLKFLKVNTSVYNVMCDDCEVNNDYHPTIKYLLLINHAGESVVVENGGSTTKRIHNDRSSIVPSSVLPILLARSYHRSGNIYPKRSPLLGTKDHTGMYHLLRQNVHALVSTNEHNVTPTHTVSQNGIYDALTGMDNREANSKVVATRKRKRTQTEEVYTVSTTADGTMTMFPDGRTTRAVPQLPGFFCAATKEAFLETHLMNIYIEALLKTGCVRASHKNIPNIFKYVQAHFATTDRLEHETILNLLFHSWHDSGLSDYAKAGTSVLDTSVIAQFNTFISKSSGDE